MRRQTDWDRMLANATRLLAGATRVRGQAAATMAHPGDDVGVSSGVSSGIGSGIGSAGSDGGRDGVSDRAGGTGPRETAMPEGVPDADDAALTPAEQRHAAGLMRVNHVGEVCAQALYQGQAATAGTEELRTYLLGAADEEKRHLDWTAARIAELGQQPSRLVPFWFASSYLIGAAAGLGGDRTSLGFMAETERQVEAHLASHLKSLPRGDFRSRAIVTTMQAEEIGHAEEALARGGRLPPVPIRGLMRALAKVMTTTAYRL